MKKIIVKTLILICLFINVFAYYKNMETKLEEAAKAAPKAE